MKTNIFIFIITLVVLFSATNCTNSRYEEQFAQINAISEGEKPDSALDLLNKINYDSLSVSDKNHYNLLLTKAQDKAYIKLSTDSIILKVIDYYASHQDDGLYPEALYYGGRVYYDMGDYPNALSYFQKALDAVPKTDLKLRGNILSQTGRLLNRLRLYEQAIPYLDKVLEIDEKCNDTINLIYDLRLLGMINFHAKNYDIAEAKLKAARKLAEGYSQSELAEADLFLAGIKSEKGQMDSALVLIHHALE